jgi:hypothetical protein
MTDHDQFAKLIRTHGIKFALTVVSNAINTVGMEQLEARKVLTTGNPSLDNAAEHIQLDRRWRYVHSTVDSLSKSSAATLIDDNAKPHIHTHGDGKFSCR